MACRGCSFWKSCRTLARAVDTLATASHPFKRRSKRLQARFMIQCTPTSLCSWDFTLNGDSHHSLLTVNHLSEQGTALIDGESFDIRKHGMTSGHWTLDNQVGTVLSAQKSSPFTRAFDFQTEAGLVTLAAASAFGRTMLIQGSGFNAAITPVHPFTRRATISETGPDYRVVCFAFWLTILLWRRAANNN